MKDYNQIKADAKAFIKGKTWSIFINLFFVYVLVFLPMGLYFYYLFSNISDPDIMIKLSPYLYLLTFHFLVIDPLLTIGVNKYMLNTIITDKGKFSDLFYSFSSGWRGFGKNLACIIIMTIILQFTTIIGEILPIFIEENTAGIISAIIAFFYFIPMIYLMLTFSQVYIIRADNAEFNVAHTFRRSKQLIHGHRGELFILNLSFFGWGLLSIIMPLVLIYFLPYIKAANTLFYLELKRTEELKADIFSLHTTEVKNIIDQDNLLSSDNATIDSDNDYEIIDVELE